MTLSIIILFCDDDVQYLSKSLECIKNHIKIPNQVILWDNRDTNKDTLPKGDYELYSQGHNIYPFEGRRCGFEKATGDFVWFVDVDDEIIGDILSGDVSDLENIDLVQMYMKTENGGLPVGTFHGQLRAFQDSLASRLIRRTFLKDLYKPITKRGINLIKFEDTFLSDLIIQHNPRVKYLDKVVYFYITERSLLLSGNTTEDKIKQADVGFENIPYLYQFLKDCDIKIKMATYARNEMLHSQN